MRLSTCGTFVLFISASFHFAATSVAQQFNLNPGDRIAIIGNTLADRMQHFGYLEALLHYRFPEHQLVIRNLGFSGDSLTVRPRSANFGSPDEWLMRVKADVIFAFFGYNESFGGEAGLPKFRQDLEEFISATLAQRYNGHSAPKLVLMLPTFHEDLDWPHLPDGTENNQRLRQYSAVMAEVAKNHKVPFVDLFTATSTLSKLKNWDDSLLRNLDGQRRDRFGVRLPEPGTASGVIAIPPVTINGIHLSDFGYRALAMAIGSTLFDRNAPQPDHSRLETIRAAVLDKNRYWHSIYRATDGYSVFGGRSALRFVDGQTNFDVMQRELEILNVQTANRDRVIWEAAQGRTVVADDSNLPEPLEVTTNKPGRLEGRKHRFLSGEEAIREMTVHQGMQIGLFASEEQFPELVNPVQSAVDPDGRLWVAAWPTYPHWNPLQPMNDKLLIFPDDDGDGKADRCIVFADGLHNPTGFEFWNGGVLVAMAPDIFFLKDMDGDDVCDVRERIFHGLDSADTHHTANAFVMGPNGKYYFSRGIFHSENFETPWAATFRAGTGAAGVYEFDPRRFDIRFHFPIGPNPHGDVFDKWGNQFATDGTGGTGNYIGYPGRGAPRQLYDRRVRPVPAIAILDSPNFPEANQGNLLIANVIGFQGVTQYRFERDGASVRATEVEPIVYSTDPNFRPSDLEIGGDGALYILDWQNPIIGHMQHNLRDPSRDHQHGRIYRLTAEDRDAQTPVRMKGRLIPEVVQHLASKMLSERYRVRLELTGRNSQLVSAAVQEWTEQFDAANPDHALALTEGLWVHQQHGIQNSDLLRRVLSSPEPDARAAAVRVLAEWSLHGAQPLTAVDTQPLSQDDAMEILINLASDDSPVVRAQAIVAAATINAHDAAEVLFAAMQQPTDVQIDFNLREAAAVIDPDGYLRRQLAAGHPLSRFAEQYALLHASVDDLLKMKETEAVYRAILTRENVPLDTLRQALDGLVRLSQIPEIELLFGLIEELNARDDKNVLNSLSRLLASQPAEELLKVRNRIVVLAKSTTSTETRRVVIASWMNVDGTSENVFAAFDQGSVPLNDILQAVPMVTSPSAQHALIERLIQLTLDLPGHQGATPLTQPGLKVDFYAPNPSDVAAETLDRFTPQASGSTSSITIEVPILQTRDQFALRFTGHIVIDRPGDYTFFIESDDGSRIYINGELLINNDGLHGMLEKSGRIALTSGMHQLLVTYFDNGGGDGLKVSWAGPGIEKQELPDHVLVTMADQTPQDQCLAAIMQLPGHEAAKTTLLAGLLRKRESVNTCLQALSSIPAEAWPMEQYGNLAEAVLSYLASRQPSERNSAQARLALDLGDSLSRRLDTAGRIRFEARLNQLVVPLIEIGTVRERMIFDREVIAVQAGRPVEFRLSNTDNMPHNFALVQPGSLEEIGELAEATGREPDAAARHFIPVSDRILASSTLLQPEQTASVYFEVPQEPGIYPYVCTYPGHWRRMYGALYVVDDLEKYTADPDAWLASSGLRPKDSMLKYLGRNTEWELDDLRGDVMHLAHRENSFPVGRQLFRVAGCVGCHRLGGEGVNLGSDLLALPKEYSSVDVLEHILEPSKKIDVKYQSTTFVLTSGKIITGLITEESDNVVRVIDNPALPAAWTVIQQSDIEERQVSDVSIMPKGVLNKLTREEILDLLAYILAAGEKDHRLFTEGVHNH